MKWIWVSFTLGVAGGYSPEAMAGFGLFLYVLNESLDEMDLGFFSPRRCRRLLARSHGGLRAVYLCFERIAR